MSDFFVQFPYAVLGYSPQKASFDQFNYEFICKHTAK